MPNSSKQLNQTFLHNVEPQSEIPVVNYPTYNRENIEIGIVHLGLGAFHRSHQAVFTEQLLNLQNGGDWGICGVTFRNQALQTQLQKQDNLYTMAVLDVQHSFQVVGAIKEVLVVKTQVQDVLGRMAAGTTKIVSLTVTEKGYCLNSAGKLDESLPGIIQDLKTPANPTTAIGLLVCALHMRFKQGDKPFNVIPCDNLPDNGHKLKSAVLQFAQQQSKELAVWIEQHVQFPNTMVDSITPQTEPETIDLIQEKLGFTDTAPVQREQFSQWVIEDCPEMERPEWEKVGVIFTDNVASFEHAKLRILNGLHSALAYIGQLKGYQSVFEAISDKQIKAFLINLVDNEIIPTITPPKGLDLHNYSRAIIARFENPKIKHLLSQIANDGSVKIPVRTLAPIQSNISAARSYQSLSMVVAAWIHFIRQSYINDKVLNDPRAQDLISAVAQFKDNDEQDVASFLSLKGLLPESLENNESFLLSVQRAYKEVL
ncbi:mannitol dehydrogenase family protein [Paraglaciecola sp.]|uniref:mannitol dehydrogenase family protein n=1 Tax=Paraglaciecola sp. TaxID=1920173 RepID=UPI003EF8C969